MIFTMNSIRNICVHLCSSAARFSAMQILVTAIVFTSFAAAQRVGPGWVWQNPLPQGNQLNSISFAKDKLSGYAVGTDNSIL